MTVLETRVNMMVHAMTSSTDLPAAVCLDSPENSVHKSFHLLTTLSTRLS